MNNVFKTTAISMLFNIAFCIYYLIFGVISCSWWLLTLGVYYFILSIVRLAVLKSKNEQDSITKFVGWMLIILLVPLIGTVVLSILKDRGNKFDIIFMIAIAVFSFTKITLATIHLIKASRIQSGRILGLRNIAFADGVVSIFALQRSMLVSFEGMTEFEIVIMNVCTGTAVCIVVFLLGFNLVRKI